jgi:hypothetical protein
VTQEKDLVVMPRSIVDANRFMALRTADASGTLGLHLIGLCLLLEREASAQQTSKLLAQFLERPLSFGRLDAPTPNGSITVSDVAAARNRDDHARLVEQWATSVWHAWASHHVAVRSWIDGTDQGNRSVHVDG